MNLASIRNRISTNGLKATHQRMIVFKDLLEREDHPTVEKIHDTVKIDNPSISLGTVYRVLEDLIKAGLVRQVATKQGLKRYDANLAPHHHIYCAKTEGIVDYYNEELHDLITAFFHQKRIKNFRIDEIRVQINGEKIDPGRRVSID